MKEYAIDEWITDLMKKCGLGTVLFPIEPVSGGFMHRMYSVRTDCGRYAVKHLNPQIMAREAAHRNFARAEKIECLLEKEGIPIVPAITVNGKKMQSEGGHYFYIFHWQEGHITDWSHISIQQCSIAGNILGKIHAIHPENISRENISHENISHEEPQCSQVNWREYVRKANDKKNEIASVLAANLQLLTDAEEELNRARTFLPDIRCVSDGDMDPKNVMWDEGNPWVIDLECLDYGNPVSDALSLALQWSGITTCSMDTEKLAAFFAGYLSAYDNGFRAYSDVFGLAYTWIEWLEYNIQRALGACTDEAERILGISEVRNTIDRIKYIRDMEEEIKRALAQVSFSSV